MVALLGLRGQLGARTVDARWVRSNQRSSGRAGRLRRGHESVDVLERVPSIGAEKTARRSASPLEVTRGNEASRRIGNAFAWLCVERTIADLVVLQASSFGA